MFFLSPPHDGTRPFQSLAQCGPFASLFVGHRATLGLLLQCLLLDDYEGHVASLVRHCSAHHTSTLISQPVGREGGRVRGNERPWTMVDSSQAVPSAAGAVIARPAHGGRPRAQGTGLADSIADRYADVLRKVHEASDGRGVLVAVSKTHSVDVVRAVARCGQRFFGENVVTDLIAKAQALAIDFPDVTWHFIGRIQSNKIRRLCDIPRLVVETVTSVRYIRLFEAARAAWRAQRVESGAPPCDHAIAVLLQVNVSGEASKGGVAPTVDALAPLIEALSECQYLKWAGLMSIGTIGCQDQFMVRRFSP